MPLKKLMKRKQDDDLDAAAAELTDDLDVEIATVRPAKPKPSKQRQRQPPSSEEDGPDDERDDDWRPGRARARSSRGPAKRPRASNREEEEEEEEAAESEDEDEGEFESDGEAGAGDDGEDDDEDGIEEEEEVVVETVSTKRARPSAGGGAASSGVVGVRAAKQKKAAPVSELPATGGKEVDKILTWRWASVSDADASDASASDAAAAAAAVPSAAAVAPTAAPAAAKGAAAVEAAPGEAPALPTGLREFYVKWAARSYHHCEWLGEARLRPLAEVKLRYFLKVREMSPAGSITAQERAEMQMGGEQEHEVVQPGWLQVERVLQRRAAAPPGPSEDYAPLHADDEVLVKWRGLGYEGITWESGRLLLGLAGAAAHVLDHERWSDRARELQPNGRKPRPQGAETPFEKYESQPAFVGGPEALPLHRYQHEGLNWLRSCWHRRLNVMLADEMGLGKTVQTVALVAALHAEYTRGPFLVCVPLSTLPNWEREFRRWAPQLNCVTYAGSKEARQLCRDFEFWFDGAAGAPRGAEARAAEPLRLHVLISSYEIVLADQPVLRRVPWEALVVDEGHRLKSKSSKLFEALQGFRTHFRLLLTGTPLQNNLEELWTLLHFLQPEEFDSLESFQASFESLDKEDQIGKLHGMLAPHILRRVKADVLRDLIPEKKELMVRVELSETQRTLYQAILTKNFEVLQRKAAQKQRSLTNVVMELKKCANHPWLVEGSAPEGELSGAALAELVDSSGKMQLLDLMLPKLHAAGHRVLVFSQMTRMLDVLEDYLLARGYGFERLDGNVGSAERQLRIDRFNRDKRSGAARENFVFLLSTRAGGLGINLATADTVVLYDSDWNPHNDIQALSRAHRLGQANKVLILRLVTRWSVEERIVQMAKKKMMMEHLVVRKMAPGANAFQAGELDDILRFGTAELFSEEAKEGVDRIVWDGAAVDRLIDRSEAAARAQVAGAEEGGQGDEAAGFGGYMDAFKVADYGTVEGEAEAEAEAAAAAAATAAGDEGEGEAEGEGEDDYWASLLGERSAQAEALEAMRMGRGKRDRSAPLNYRETNLPLWQAMEADEAAQKEEEKRRKEAEKEERRREKEERAAREAERRAEKLRARLKEWEPPPLLAWDANGSGNYSVHGFSWRERRSFLKMLLRFGLLGGAPLQIHRMCKADSELKRKRLEEVTMYTNRTLLHLMEAQRDELDPAKVSMLAEAADESGGGGSGGGGGGGGGGGAEGGGGADADGADPTEARAGRSAAAAVMHGAKYRDGVPVEKRSVEVGTVLRRLWLMELVRAKLVECGVISRATADGEDEAVAAAAAARAEAAEKAAAAAAKEAEAAAKAAAAGAAAAGGPGAAAPEPAPAPAPPPAPPLAPAPPPPPPPPPAPAAPPMSASDAPFLPVRFRLPPPEMGRDLAYEYVDLASRPERPLRRGPRGWDLLCDKLLLLGVHLHGFCPGATPAVHWDAVLDESLGLLEPALEQVEPQVKQLADDRAAAAAAVAARLAAASPHDAPLAAAPPPPGEPDAELDDDDDDDDDDDRPLSSFVMRAPTPPPPAAAPPPVAASPSAGGAAGGGGAPAAALSPLMLRLERPNAKELVRQFVGRRSRILLQLLEAEYMLDTAPRRAVAPARWEAAADGVVTPSPRDKEVVGLRRAARDAAEGCTLAWQPPRVAQLLPPEALAYQVQRRAPAGGGGGGAAAEPSPPDVIAAADDDPAADDEVRPRDGGGWVDAHAHALREPRAASAQLSGALRASDECRVRAFCGVFGWGPWVLLPAATDPTPPDPTPPDAAPMDVD